eukprot:scaffold263730_cov17-Tisochrysis_lutea.AAC.1
MSPNNPTQTCKQYTSFKCPRKEEEVIELDDGDEEAGPSRFAKRLQSSLTSYMLCGEAGCCQQRLCFVIPLSPFRRPSWLATLDAFSAEALEMSCFGFVWAALGLDQSVPSRLGPRRCCCAAATAAQHSTTASGALKASLGAARHLDAGRAVHGRLLWQSAVARLCFEISPMTLSQAPRAD